MEKNQEEEEEEEERKVTVRVRIITLNKRFVTCKKKSAILFLS
jgi:hypothetical protein